VILCGTRPKHPHLHWLDQRDKVHRIDLDHRPESNETACRAVLELHSNAASPPFDRALIEEVIRRAQGNLLYTVRLAARLEDLPVEQRMSTNLPQGLRGFFELIWSDLQKLDDKRRELVIKGLGVASAAREPLPEHVFGEILGWPTTKDGETFFCEARPLLLAQRAEWHNGVPAYRPFHESIRDFIIEKLGVPTVREHQRRISRTLAKWPPDQRDAPQRAYALRHAVAHRIAAGDVAGAQRLCTDVDYLVTKCRELGVAAIEQDIDATMRAMDGGAALELRAILTTVSAEGHRLRENPACLPALLYNNLLSAGRPAAQISRLLRFNKGLPAPRLLHPVRLGATLLRSFSGHESSVVACVVTRDGDHILSASADHTLRRWALRSGECVRVLAGHENEITSTAVTQDGRWAISTSADASVKLWDLNAGRCVDIIKNAPQWPTACALSPDDQLIVVGFDDGSLEVWDRCSRARVRALRGHADYVTACLVTRSGRVISASRDASVRAWDIASGDLIHTLRTDEGAEEPVARRPEERQWITAVAVVSNEKFVFGATGDGLVLQWSLSSGHLVESFRAAKCRIDACAISSADRHLLCGIADGSIVIWSLAAMKPVHRIHAHTGAVAACSVTPDGQRVVSASQDRSVKLWELGAPESLPQEGHSARVIACAITPNAAIAVSGSEDGTVKVWSLATGECVTVEEHADEVTACAASDRCVASGWRDGSLRVWSQGPSARSRVIQAHSGEVSGCAITRNGLLITTSRDRTLKIWRADTLELVQVFEHAEALDGLAINADGSHALVIGGSSAVTLLDLATMTSDPTLRIAGGGLHCAALIPDGQRAVFGREDGTVEIYDLQARRRVYALREHEGKVQSCAVSPNGAFLVSASEDETVRIFRLKDYELVGSLYGRCRFRCVAAAGSQLCAGDEEGNVWLVELDAPGSRAAIPGSRLERRAAPASPQAPSAQPASPRQAPKAGAKNPRRRAVAPLGGAILGGAIAHLMPLQDVLAELCYNTSTARLIAAQAGLDVKRIDMNGSPWSFWGAILEEAHHQGRVKQLVERAWRDVAGHPQLAAAARACGIRLPGARPSMT
jgi:WD40 repeat protein